MLQGNPCSWQPCIADHMGILIMVRLLLACIECYTGFPSQETGTDTFSLSHVMFQQFSCFSLWSVFETFFSWLPQAWTVTLPWCYFHQICFVHLLIDLGLWFELLTKQEFSHSTLCAICENRIYKTLQKLCKPSFACRNLTCKRHETHVCLRH